MKTYKERTDSILAKAEAGKQQRKKIIKFSAIASVAAAAILAFNLVLFVPYTVDGTDITAYSSSEYYGVIRQLYGLTYSPRKTNNFNEWMNNMFAYGAAAPGGDKGYAPAQSESPSSAGNNYNETTLNQTDGVIEGDLFKRSDTHIFYLGFTPVTYNILGGGDNGPKKSEASYNLRVYTLAGEESQKVAEYHITADSGMSFGNYSGEYEMYLSEDLNTVTVVTDCYDDTVRMSNTMAVSLDISDLSNIKENGRAYVAGDYVSSRMVDGNMLLVTDFLVRRNVDFDNELLYVPYYAKGGQRTPLLAGDIVCPSNATSSRYSVVCSLNGDMEVNNTVALLSFSGEVYVSQNNLFATRSYSEFVDTKNEYGLKYSIRKTDIRIIPFDSEGLGEPRVVTTYGTVLNRYCLDEYEGTLRVVSNVVTSNHSYSYMDSDPYRNRLGNRCFLYCYDLNTLEQVAKVNFAPVGESVMSARFYGDTAYVCTAEIRNNFVGEATAFDPVFAFDLSDLDNITYKDTGTIPGYSLSLTDFAYDTLLGIGYGDNNTTLKIELYEQTETSVEPIAKYELDGVRFSQEFKAHMIDADNCLIGLGMRNADKMQYKVLRYDGYHIKEVLSLDMNNSSDFDKMRATVVYGYIYIFEDIDNEVSPGFKAVELD